MYKTRSSFYHSVLVMVWLTLSTTLISQTVNFKAAVIVENGNAITGFINQLDDVSMNERIEFKKQLNNDEVRSLSPIQISAYTLTASGTKYQSILHTYQSNAGVNMEELRFGRVLLEGEKFSLFRVELSGEAYKQRYIVSEIPEYVYYIQDEGSGELYRLQVTEKLYEGKQFKVINAYKGALKYLLKDWKYASQAIDRTDFNDRALIQLLENYHHHQNYEVSVNLREEAKFKHNSLRVHFGYIPLALPESVTHQSGYLFGATYEYKNDLKRFPTLQVNFDYINLKYDRFESTGLRMNRKFFGTRQIQFLIGPKHEFFQSKEDFALYVRAAAGFCRRTYLYQFERFQVDAQFDGTLVYNSLGFINSSIKEDNFILNFGTGVEYKNLYLDLGMDRVSYSFLLQQYTPSIRLGYKL